MIVSDELLTNAIPLISLGVKTTDKTKVEYETEQDEVLKCCPSTVEFIVMLWLTEDTLEYAIIVKLPS